MVGGWGGAGNIPHVVIGKPNYSSIYNSAIVNSMASKNPMEEENSSWRISGGVTLGLNVMSNTSAILSLTRTLSHGFHLTPGESGKYSLTLCLGWRNELYTQSLPHVGLINFLLLLKLNIIATKSKSSRLFPFYKVPNHLLFPP